MFEDFKIDEELHYRPRGCNMDKTYADEYINELNRLHIVDGMNHQMQEDIKFLLTLLFEKANTQEEWDKCKEIESRYNIEV